MNWGACLLSLSAVLCWACGAKAGIGGERTDQARKRLANIIALKPRLVTIMYGTNDSYVDKGEKEPRLSVPQYRENLQKLVKDLRQAGILPVLMTPPRWGDKARNGAGDNPNPLLEKYVEACREVARTQKVPLVDHYAHGSKRVRTGQDIAQWTTDQCHPNPRGHREMADIILPVVAGALLPLKR